jgi:hypothetical protein
LKPNCRSGRGTILDYCSAPAAVVQHALAQLNGAGGGCCTLWVGRVGPEVREHAGTFL